MDDIESALNSDRRKLGRWWSGTVEWLLEDNEKIRRELEDAAYNLSGLLNEYKFYHPDDDIRILTIRHIESKINHYLELAGRTRTMFDG